jgi:hypothetical protein
VSDQARARARACPLPLAFLPRGFSLSSSSALSETCRQPLRFAIGRKKIKSRFHTARVIFKIHGVHPDEFSFGGAGCQDHPVPRRTEERSPGFSGATETLIFPSDRNVQGKVNCLLA